jgi:hypothetical protein
MKVPGGPDQASSRLTVTPANLAQTAACPIPCWRYHIANLIRKNNAYILATRCELCGQIISSEEWRREFGCVR